MLGFDKDLCQIGQVEYVSHLVKLTDKLISANLFAKAKRALASLVKAPALAPAYV